MRRNRQCKDLRLRQAGDHALLTEARGLLEVRGWPAEVKDWPTEVMGLADRSEGSDQQN